jgi:hypothetical protein
LLLLLYNKKAITLRYFKTIILFVLLLSSIYYSIIVHKNEIINQSIKNDLIELSKIKYGLFNVDEWKIILIDIISDKVEKFNLDNGDKNKLRLKISTLLHNVIDEYEEVFINENSNSLWGSMKKIAYSTVNAFGDIKEKIPIFTDKILFFLNEKQNRENLKNYIRNLINEYADETFSKTDYSTVSLIVNKYNSSNKFETIKLLNNKLKLQDEKMFNDKLFLLFSFIIVILLLQFSQDFSKFDLSTLLLICLIFLLLGVTLPMIEIDARISKMEFLLLGNNINFENQILFYKSKSIIEVVYLMIAQNKIGIMLVGILVLLFSVLFPVIKLISSFFWIFKIELRSNKFVFFFVHKSGKWSMADVFVIAILMSFIGFDGIVNDQLNELEKISTSFNLITTNESNLMFGFYAFSGFVILGIFISQKLKNRINKLDSPD